MRSAWLVKEVNNRGMLPSKLLATSLTRQAPCLPAAAECRNHPSRS